jgi:hypothetical protein
MKLLHLRGALQSTGKRTFSRRKCTVQSYNQRVVAENRIHRLGRKFRFLLLQYARRVGELLRDMRISAVHCCSFMRTAWATSTS